MEAEGVFWILFFLSVSSAGEMPSLSVESTVFVLVSGCDLDLHVDVYVVMNGSRDVLTCSDPEGSQIYSCDVHETPQHQNLTLTLKNLTRSGEYRCQYHTTTAFWFLRVTSDHYKNHMFMDYTELYVVGFITVLLLIFSVIGSVCVFKRHRKDCVTDCWDISRKREEEERSREVEEENEVDSTTTPSTSFYASLETRPRSIYDVLDRSAASREPQQRPEKPKKKPKIPVAPTRPAQQDGVFESVYENFQS